MHARTLCSAWLGFAFNAESALTRTWPANSFEQRSVSSAAVDVSEDEAALLQADLDSQIYDHGDYAPAPKEYASKRGGYYDRYEYESKYGDYYDGSYASRKYGKGQYGTKYGNGGQRTTGTRGPLENQRTTGTRGPLENHNLFVVGFQPYHNYDGPLTVSGTLTASFNDKQIFLDWDLGTADDKCGSVALPNGQISNDCGVHIHTNMTCAEDAGPHLWKLESADDPWKNIHYAMSAASAQGVTTLGAKSVARRVPINAGITMDDALGRAVVVHDITGTRIACGILRSMDELDKDALQVKSFMPYPGYTGPLSVTGSMRIATINKVQYLSWNLQGGDLNCGSTAYPHGLVSNDCGVHIHVGETCDDADVVKGHYNKTKTDPWKHVHYSSYGGQAFSSSERVEAMLRASDIEGRAMVVHDLNGARIACGLITRP